LHTSLVSNEYDFLPLKLHECSTKPNPLLVKSIKKAKKNVTIRVGIFFIWYKGK
jgi:hypothetical protein